MTAGSRDKKYALCQLLEGTDDGLKRLASFDEHLGCTCVPSRNTTTPSPRRRRRLPPRRASDHDADPPRPVFARPCGAFEASELRHGPWVLDPSGTALVAASSTFTNADATCARQNVTSPTPGAVRFETGGAATAPLWDKALYTCGGASAGNGDDDDYCSAPPTASMTAAPSVDKPTTTPTALFSAVVLYEGVACSSQLCVAAPPPPKISAAPHRPTLGPTNGTTHPPLPRTLDPARHHHCRYLRASIFMRPPSLNLGQFETAEACARNVSRDADCGATFMWSSVLAWGCRCCDAAAGGSANANWDVYILAEVQ